MGGGSSNKTAVKMGATVTVIVVIVGGLLVKVGN